MDSNKMTPEEAKRRLEASRRADWGIRKDTEAEDIQRYADHLQAVKDSNANFYLGYLPLEFKHRLRGIFGK